MFLMHIASYRKTKVAPSDTPNKSGTQQKKHSLMTNTPPKIDKYDTHKKLCFTKMVLLMKKCPKVIWAELSDF